MKQVKGGDGEGLQWQEGDRKKRMSMNSEMGEGSRKAEGKQSGFATVHPSLLYR